MIRKADPYRDTDVIDARAPRTNQAIVGTLSLLALITGWWPILGVLAGQLAIGLVFGRRYCLPCFLYFEVIQPRVGEGRIEDSRPPRFANIVGAVFLGAATIAYLVGLNAIGLVLGLIVGGLSVLIFPHPLTHRSRIPGISLIAGPLITGVLMWATGALLRSQDKKSTRMESFGYASTFAFAMALVRFIFARPA